MDVKNLVMFIFEKLTLTNRNLWLKIIVITFHRNIVCKNVVCDNSFLTTFLPTSFIFCSTPSWRVLSFRRCRMTSISSSGVIVVSLIFRMLTIDWLARREILIFKSGVLKLFWLATQKFAWKISQPSKFLMTL